MIIKLIPSQIPAYWDIIKHAALNADAVPEKAMGGYCINLLLDLLSSKAICLVSANNEKAIQRILIVGFEQDGLFGTKTMVFRVLYGFDSGTEQDWIEDSSKVYEWAVYENCDLIKAFSKSERVFDLAKTYGFKKAGETYVLPLRGSNG